MSLKNELEHCCIIPSDTIELTHDGVSEQFKSEIKELFGAIAPVFVALLSKISIRNRVYSDEEESGVYSDEEEVDEAESDSSSEGEESD